MRGAVAAMALATLLWGATFVVIRDSVRSLSPQALVATRFALATLAWALLLGSRRALARGPSPDAAAAAWKGGLLAGPCMAAGYLLQAIGLVRTSAGSSAFLTSAGTLMAAFLAWPLLGQRPGGRLVFGIGLALAGSALMGLDRGLRLGAGEAWTLAGALAFALQVVALSRWARLADAALLSAVQAGVTTLLVLPFAGSAPAELARATPEVAWGLAYLVVAGALAAPLLQVLAQQRLPAGRIGLLFALEPVFALFFAVSVGGERFAARWFVGAGLILAGVIAVESRAPERSGSP